MREAITSALFSFLLIFLLVLGFVLSAAGRRGGCGGCPTGVGPCSFRRRLEEVERRLREGGGG